MFFRSSIFKPNGRFIKEGDIVKRTKYAKTLQRIADSGAKLFYTGEMAKQVIRLEHRPRRRASENIYPI